MASKASTVATTSTEVGKMLCVASCSGEQFNLSEKAASLSTLLDNLLQDCPEPEDEEPLFFPIMTSETLKKVIEWMEYHRDDPRLIDHKEDDYEKYERDRREDAIPPWDQDFLNLRFNELCDILTAANFLQVQGLEDMTSMTIANLLNGKTHVEMRNILRVEGDYTPEEEAKLLEEGAWCQGTQ
jgi:S-phase kinase-associated protein 1